MFCLGIPNLPFGWQPCYFRHPPCFIHISSVQAAELKSSRSDVSDPSDVLMRSLTLPSMFSTSLSTVSFNLDDWAPSVSTTLGYNTLASEESIHSSPAAWCSCERGRQQPSSCASEWPCLWVIPPSELLLTACSSSLSDCCSCGAEPPAVTRPEGQPALFPLEEKKRQGRRGEEWKSIPH